MSQVQGECGSSVQLKQKRSPQLHSGSQCGSPSMRTALPQCGTLRAQISIGPLVTQPLHCLMRQRSGTHVHRQCVW